LDEDPCPGRLDRRRPVTLLSKQRSKGSERMNSFEASFVFASVQSMES
jgi:hypothetical protein